MSKVYVTTQPITVEATFWEPIDDGHPDIGSYSRDVKPTIPENTRLFINERGYITGVKGANLASGYGVSMHEGHVSMYYPVSEIDSDAIKEISEEEWEKIWEAKCNYNRSYNEFCYHHEICDDMDFHEGFLGEEIEKVVTASDYEKLSNQMWEDCRIYISHMAQAMTAWANMEKCMI